MMLKLFKSAMLLLPVLILSACSGGSLTTTSSTGTTEVTVALQALPVAKEAFKVMTSTTKTLSFRNYTSRAVIPQDVTAIVITTSGAEFNPLVANVSVSGATANAFPKKLTVPNGKDRTITIECKNAAGAIVYVGKVTIPMLDGTPVTVPMSVTYIVGLSKTYGGAKLDYAAIGRQTKDSGYFLAGGTRSFGTYSGSGWAVKLKSNGSVMWQKAYSPSPTLAALGYSSTALFGSETTDGGFFVTGRAYNSTGTKSHTLAMKLDKQGTPGWTKLIAGSGGSGSFDMANSYDFTSDGGYILSADTQSFVPAQAKDFWFMKLLADGTLDWNATVGGTGADVLPFVSEVSGNPRNYVAVGLANSTTTPAVAIFGFTSAGFNAPPAIPGGTIVPALYTMSGLSSTANPRMTSTTDGGYIVSSIVDGGAAPVKGLWVMKFDKSLNLLWQKLVPGTYSAVRLSRTADGGAVLGASTTGGEAQAFKLDASGTIVWSKTYAKTGTNTVRSIHENSDGTFTITVQNLSAEGDLDVWLLKTDTTGTVSGTTTPLGVATTLTTSTPTSTKSSWTGVTWAVPAAGTVTVSNPTLSITDTNTVPTN